MEKAGLYFHIPFCKSKCPYCDFYSQKYNEQKAIEYVLKLNSEIKKYSGSFDTVYFGGGTPSILPSYLIGDILKTAKGQFEFDKNSEITIECNPSKNLKDDFIEYKKMGINRISLGMQSAVKKERFALGRVAGENEVKIAIGDALNAGIENISLDLMIGTPHQTLESLDYTLDFIDKVNVKHVSAYMLKIEEGTKFFEMKDSLDLVNDDIVSDMYLKVVDSLNQIGFKQYEISNFAKKGYESKHNLKYWKLVPYLGIGATAHSFWNGKRFFYNKDFKIVQDGVGGTDEEKIMLGLRLNEGVDINLINKDYSKFVDLNLLEIKNKKLALTKNGMLVSNYIISELI